MQCPFCNEIIPDDSRYCDQCGERLIETENAMFNVLKFKDKKGAIKYDVRIIDTVYTFTEKQYRQFIQEAVNLPKDVDISA